MYHKNSWDAAKMCYKLWLIRGTTINDSDYYNTNYMIMIMINVFCSVWFPKRMFFKFKAQSSNVLITQVSQKLIIITNENKLQMFPKNLPNDVAF